MQVLEKFLTEKDFKVAEESQWLRSIKADCVLSDAAFLGWYVLHCYMSAHTRSRSYVTIQPCRQ